MTANLPSTVISQNSPATPLNPNPALRMVVPSLISATASSALLNTLDVCFGLGSRVSLV